MQRFAQRGCLFISVFCLLLGGCMVGAASRLPAEFSTQNRDSIALDGWMAAVSIDTNPQASTMQTVGRMDDGLTATAKLFGVFPIKEVSVKVTDPPKVVVGGLPFGIKLYTDGVMVVGMADVATATGAYNPAKTAGIKIGDVIVSIDGTSVTTNEQVAELVQASGGKTMIFRVRRDNITFDIRFRPAQYAADGSWKAGLWVRDSSAGIGTLTFYDPATGRFGGLGHAVCDVDTGDALPIADGEIVPVEIYSVVKGESGHPGELRGGFADGSWGRLTINGDTGVFGQMTEDVLEGKSVPIAFKQQIKRGAAQICTTIEGCDPKWYDIEIEQVRYADSSPNRHMVIRVTDPDLLAATGGIVQGMSGSPIVQDGKLVGAVTHVFVNDPEKGFAIFAENMLASAKRVEQPLLAVS